VVDGMRKAGHNGELIINSLGEGFWVYMKLAILGGCLVAGPFVFWELWKFVGPGLYRKEKRIAGLITGATAFCFAAGAVFAYFVMCEPAAYVLTKILSTFNEGSAGI